MKLFNSHANTLILIIFQPSFTFQATTRAHSTNGTCSLQLFEGIPFPLWHTTFKSSLKPALVVNFAMINKSGGQQLVQGTEYQNK